MFLLATSGAFAAGVAVGIAMSTAAFLVTVLMVMAEAISATR